MNYAAGGSVSVVNDNTNQGGQITNPTSYTTVATPATPAPAATPAGTITANPSPNYESTASAPTPTPPAATPAASSPAQTGAIPTPSASSGPTTSNVGSYTQAQQYQGGGAGQSNTYGGWGASSDTGTASTDPASNPAAAATPASSTSASYTAPASPPAASYTSPYSMGGGFAGGYAQGGPVDPDSAAGAAAEDTGAIPDDNPQNQPAAPGPQDPTGGANTPSNPQNQPAQQGPDINQSLGTVQDAYSQLRASMLKGGTQTAMMPSRPAGPGGEPNQNPFPTKTPAIPFGKLAAADSRPIPPAPNGPPVKPFNPRDYLPVSQGQGAIPTEATA